MAQKVFILSLGCPKNLTDAEVMAGQLASAGFELTTDEAKADIALINTCAFLNSAVEESEEEIERFVSLKERGKLAKIAVTGCLVEREKEALLRKFPQIDAIVGINGLDRINSAVNGDSRYILPAETALTAPKLKLRLTAPHSAYLKIADGCDNHCAYCLIPMLRGHFRSKRMEDVIEEAKNLAASGAKEISLIAQDTTSYGLDVYGRPKLYDLLKELVKLDGISWLRLMYVHPEKLSPEILKLMRDEEKICHYLDMPLQHISDPMLKAMNRKSSERAIKTKIAAIRKLIPDMAFRTNFIVGFPGETDKDFKKLTEFVAETGFDNLGVFKYSREAGTPAANLPGQVDEKIKTDRFNTLINEQSLIIDKINSGLIGRNVKVLLDSPAFGRTYRDAPDIDGKIEVISKSSVIKPGAKIPKNKSSVSLTPGKFVNVTITGATGYLRRGRLE